jgi:preprotein translocase subunit SecG
VPRIQSFGQVMNFLLSVTSPLHFLPFSGILPAMDSLVRLLPWVQIIASIVLVIAILLQKSGSGLGSSFGGGDGIIYHTKRGFEKFLFNLTIILAILFAALSIAQIILK